MSLGVTSSSRQAPGPSIQVAATPSQRAGSNCLLFRQARKRVQFQSPGCVPSRGHALEKRQYGNHIPFLRAALRLFQRADGRTSVPAHGRQPGASSRADSGSCCQQEPALSSKDSDWTDAKGSRSPERLTSGCRKPKGQHLAPVGHCLAELAHHVPPSTSSETELGSLVSGGSRHSTLRPLPQAWRTLSQGQLSDLTSQKSPGSCTRKGGAGGV